MARRLLPDAAAVRSYRRRRPLPQQNSTCVRSIRWEDRWSRWAARCPRGSPQRRCGAADVGRHPGLPGPLRLRLRDGLRVGVHCWVCRRKPGSQIRVRDFVLRHAAPPQYTVHPYRPVTIEGKVSTTSTRRHGTAGAHARIRLGAQVCGDPAHDPEFGGRLPGAARQAPGRYPLPAKTAVGFGRHRHGRRDRVVTVEHSWLPRASCDASCVRAGGAQPGRPVVVALRTALRVPPTCRWCLHCRCWRCRCPAAPYVRAYCGLMLRCLGVRITVSGRFATCVACWWSAATYRGSTSSPSAPCCPARGQGRAVRLARAGRPGPLHESHPDRSGQPSTVAGRGEHHRRPVAPGTPWSRSPRAPRGAASPTGRSDRRCSRPRSTRADRSSRCGWPITVTAGRRPSWLYRRDTCSHRSAGW